MQPTKAVIVVLAALVALLGAMALGCFSDADFALDRTVGPGDGPFVGAKAAAAPEPPLAALLAKADAAKGQNDVKACQACHSFDKGGAAKVGPPLWGVVGRPVASVAGFAYSDAVKAIGGDWTYEKLNQWITKPAAMAAGTKMAFPGEPEATKRADILAYLQKQSDSPLPFPQ